MVPTTKWHNAYYNSIFIMLLQMLANNKNLVPQLLSLLDKLRRLSMVGTTVFKRTSNTPWQMVNCCRPCRLFREKIINLNDPIIIRYTIR